MGNWQDEYQRKFISAEQAAELVKDGDQVVFTLGREAHAVGLAIAARKNELKNIQIYAPTPSYDFGWYDEGWQDSFTVEIYYPTSVCADAVEAKRCDINPGSFVSPSRGFLRERQPNIVLTEVSPPDDKGFCSFGQSLWDKKRVIKQGKLVVAEVNKNLIRTYGDNFIHVSEIDYFVEHISSDRSFRTGTLVGRELKELESYLKDVAGYVSELIKDRDTIQIGVGRATEPLVQLGMLNEKHDLGIHSEATVPGIISLVRKGVITGKYKTLNPGKVIVTSLGGGTREEMEWAKNNPLFWLVDVDYLEDIRVIAAHDNMVAINSAVAIDLGGQISAQTAGGRLVGGAGGQIPFVFGALLSRGGRSLIVLPSTATGGKFSRIVSQLPAGAVVTTLRACADYVVTEYGIASLWGKSVRQRAQELISIAHPDFRGELKREAQRLF